MTQLAGITIENDTTGNPRFMRIDLQKHSKELAGILEKLGVADINTDLERSITANELVDRLRPRLQQLSEK